MSQIKVTCVLDSINPFGDRLTTFEAEIPKFILAQLNTHRQLSRNAASSRAIPLSRFRELASYVPDKWMANGKGMSPSEELSNHMSLLANDTWTEARDVAIQSHRFMEDGVGLHKEQANRLLEPFVMVKVLLSATEWDNFLNLRLEDGAQSEIREVAQGIGKHLIEGTPRYIDWMEWHMPFMESCKSWDGERVYRNQSAARCARVSYLNHDKSEPDWNKDLELADRLIESKHLSPFEHVAMACPGRSGNYNGWLQYRSLLYDDRIKDQSWKERIK